MVKVAERLRRQAPQTAIQRREDAALPVREGQAHAGRPLLLDTCVYIHQMQGRAPPLVQDLLGIRTVNHGTVAIQDPMHTVGVLDPKTPAMPRPSRRSEPRSTSMPGPRMVTPDPEIL